MSVDLPPSDEGLLADATSSAPTATNATTKKQHSWPRSLLTILLKGFVALSYICNTKLDNEFAKIAINIADEYHGFNETTCEPSGFVLNGDNIRRDQRPCHKWLDTAVDEELKSHTVHVRLDLNVELGRQINRTWLVIMDLSEMSDSTRIPASFSWRTDQDDQFDVCSTSWNVSLENYLDFNEFFKQEKTFEFECSHNEKCCVSGCCEVPMNERWPRVFYAASTFTWFLRGIPTLVLIAHLVQCSIDRSNARAVKEENQEANGSEEENKQEQGNDEEEINVENGRNMVEDLEEEENNEEEDKEEEKEDDDGLSTAIEESDDDDNSSTASFDFADDQE